MRSEKLKSSILAARDRRSVLLGRHLEQGHRAMLFLSLNIAGKKKIPSGSERLFSWGLGQISREFPEATELFKGDDALGPFAVFSVDREPVAAKWSCIRLEGSLPAARLIDLDVYDGNGRRTGRADIGSEPRTCLLCPLPAVECIRLGRHQNMEITAKTDELLAHFRD